MRRLAAIGLTLALILAVSLPVGAATIVIVNNDGAGEGFNDPTVVAPVGGNPGTTIGQQRINVFQRAADIWGANLPSNVTIRVQSQFNPLSCDASSAVLGSAGPIEVFRNFPGAPVANTWYHVALANKIAGFDQSGSNDISATFNSSIDNNNTCLNGTNWYYGLDGNEGGDVELLPVVLHEIGHGLGFSTLVSLSSGSEFLGFSDIYETYLFDNSTGLNWDQMSNGQRAASAVNTDNVVWDGPLATAAAPCFLGGPPTLFINSPSPPLPAEMLILAAAFGAEFTTAGVTGNVVLVDDGSGVITDGCQALINGGAVSGNIALIDRGVCAFVTKAQNAQAAGAIGVILVNNVAGPPITPGGSDPSITIPVGMISLDDGNSIKAQLGGGVNVTMGLDPSILSGTDSNGLVKVYAPNPLQLGSSISHWDVSAAPNLLMEPAINGNLSSDIDLTLAHFSDIGWRTDCLTLACPSDTTVAFDTLVNLNFCVTNCGDDDTVRVTITDSAGWCTPIDQMVGITNGNQVCIPVSCTTPDTCATLMTDVTMVVKNTAGAIADTCTMTITSQNTAPVAICQNVNVVGSGNPCTAAVTPAQVDDGSFDPDGGGVTLALQPVGPYAEGINVVSLIVTDDCGAADTCQATVTVSCAAPLLVVEPALINFSTVAFGDTACDSVCVINTGGSQLDITSITGCGTDGFFVDQTGFSTMIAPGDTSKFAVCFSPTPAGPDTCVLTVNSNGGSEQVTVQVNAVSAVGVGSVPPVFQLAPVLPTPFSASAEVRFSLPVSDRVQVDVFDFQGRLIRALLPSQHRSAGAQSVDWDGRDDRGVAVAGGIYFVRVATANNGNKVVRAVRLSQ